MFIPWGPPGDNGEPLAEVVASYGPIELEYAALRRAAGVMHAAHLGVIRVTGEERLGFLDRMLTQSVGRLPEGAVCSAFLLERTGRIIADLLLIERGDETLVVTDVHQVPRVCEVLDSAIFIEEIAITDCTTTHTVLEVHGPEAAAVVQAFDGVAIARPMLGVPGFLAIATNDGAEAAWNTLLGADERVRGIGWFAYNIARIEAGTPLWNVDFGATNLPHETGVVEDRVSFATCCYPGQEVVARIQNLGEPKQRLIGLHGGGEAVPPAGAAVCLDEDGKPGDPVGVVTSSAPSPMLGAKSIAFAMLKRAAAADETKLIVEAEGEWSAVQAGPLRFWSA